jgi:hypothetical protein
MRRVLFAVITLVMLAKLELTSASAQTNPTVYLEAKDELANYFSLVRATCVRAAR